MLMFIKKSVVILCSIMLLVISTSHASYANENTSNFNIGTGIYDITGPAAEVVMMGYASSDQTTGGIHMRLRSRAFVITNEDKRVVFVSADLGQIFQGVKQGVMRKLHKTYGDLYRDENVLLSATHTHSGPAGHSHYALYNISAYGYIEQNYECIVDGIYQSIVRAHNNLEPGYIEINSSTLQGTSINRSIEAYNNNEEAERDMFEDDVDRDMVMLNLKNSDDELLGIINWFPIHPTSMGNDNHLISSDNKGYASYLFENDMGTEYMAEKTFIAAFAQSDCGDSSPNIYGGEQGYGDNDFESTKYAGEQQYEKCCELSDGAYTLIDGSIDYRHKYIDFSDIDIAPEYINYKSYSEVPTEISEDDMMATYDAAIGYSFACGAEDGPSNIDMFHEGMKADEYPIEEGCNLVKTAQQFLNIIPEINTVNGLKYPELWDEHYPKPILFATGKGEPYPWTPEILPVQIVQIGQLVLVAVPAEFTSMSGRRLKSIIKKTMDSGSDIDHTVVIAGLSNAYSGYVATPEEYDVQHYEGASTHFGKWTLPAYIQEFHGLANDMKSGAVTDSGPTPRNLIDEQMCFQTGVVLDNVPIGKEFGDVEQQVDSSYNTGETVTVSFWTGHPKNDLKIQSTYLEVQHKVDGEWITIANDWDFETKYKWIRKDPVWGSSLAKIKWTIPEDTLDGIYRIVHHGAYKNGWTGKICDFDGVSNEFQVN
ncbi:neutral ceramidase [Vallitalea longa]|uniref:Neutral ceramidase n=1 Tax=Vallitalea longa TaxID=2936439 RepID=A0A9W5YFW9_9FIRM|nr:neutral/alkaline non-lysosomal ceramidase N-terminal domain-containing protein [Vallitalea longa]GKX31568.1 neutral ceramidase [Vallitalea longa]